MTKKFFLQFLSTVRLYATKTDKKNLRKNFQFNNCQKIISKSGKNFDDLIFDFDDS